VRLKGIDYAWIYPTPREIPDEAIPAQHVKRVQFGDEIALLGYDAEVKGDELVVTLYWQSLGRKPEEDLTVEMVLFSQGGKILSCCEGPLIKNELFSAALAEERMVLKDERRLPVSKIPKGIYSLKLRLLGAIQREEVRELKGSVILGSIELK